MATTEIYTVESTDGGSVLVIQPRTFNGTGGVLRSTDLILYGNAQPSWGEKFNENFYKLTENFACEDIGHPAITGAPKGEVEVGETGKGINAPLAGQLWYSKTDTQLYLQTTPTNDLDTTPAVWERMAKGSEVDALSGSVSTDISDLQDDITDLENNKINRAGDVSLTGVHSYPYLFFNEGNGDTSVGSDIRMHDRGQISCDSDMFINIDGDNSGSGSFVIGKGAHTDSATSIMSVNVDGLIREASNPSTYAALVATTAQAIPNRQYVDDAITTGIGSIQSFPPGVVMPYAGSSAPTGFVLCNGASLDAVTFPQYLPLYNAIGLTYGGTGSNNFQVPDMRGKTAVGIGAGSFGALGTSIGAETHTLTTTEIASHGHTGVVSGSTDAESSHDHWTLGGASPQSTGASGDDKNVQDRAGYTVSPTTPHSHTITGASVVINTAGGGQPHNNLQPSFGLNYIISL